LYVNELSKSYGNVVALAPCSFSLEKGEILGLLGESGSGKTTLLRLVGGFEMPRSGSMSLNGTLMNDRGLFVSPEKRKIGIVFQDYALFPHLTVAQNIAFGLKAPHTVQQLLQVVGLDGYQDRKPDEISGGQQQRVAIARALAADPDLLLLDEPFSNIDESMKFSFRRELRDILKKAGTTAIFVTHDTRDALDLGDKVMVIQNGLQVQVGKPEDIYLRPASAYVAQLLGPINHIDTSRCIRAEHVQVQQSSHSHAEVVRSVFQGSVYHVHVRTDEGSNWIASSPEDWHAGTRVELKYDPQNILTFPA
jgi:iron(III) transport system ATP-binding protein